MNSKPISSIQQRIQLHKATGRSGVTSVCSAHPEVIIAAAQLAQQFDEILLIESTSNQVDQFGGYTGMMPKDFVAYVRGLLETNGLSSARLVLGGDHLGPNAWQHLNSDVAMNHAEELIRQYVTAGYQKIHLDCSMSCADDPKVLSDEVVAQRAARLCKIAEATAQSTQQAHEIVYVIGTEVPVPGGAQEDLGVLVPTTPEAARTTYEIHRAIFAEWGLAAVWPRVVGLVVQPGVEFDHHTVVDYQPEQARRLSALVNEFPHMVFEAHSTDYQRPQAFKDLVRDHFAILKVGPALTFALREAYFALDDVAQTLQPDAPSLKASLEAVMLAEPKYWKKYYEGDAAAQKLARAYSLSDRSRYYWPDPRMTQAVSHLKTIISQRVIPLGVLKQYLPVAYQAVREGQIAADFEALVRFHIQQALLPYYQASHAVTAESVGA